MWWHELQIKRVRKWTEELKVFETWEWITPLEVLQNPTYHGAFDGETVSGEIHETGRSNPED